MTNHRRSCPGRRYRTAAAAVAVLALVAGAGCSDDDDTAGNVGLEVVFDDVVAATGTGDVEGPSETTSKDKSWLSGTGVVDGEPSAALEAITTGLEEAGWVTEPEVSSGGGLVVVAVAGDGESSTQIGVYETIGTRTASDGSSFVQISVADADAGLDWTP